MALPPAKEGREDLRMDSSVNSPLALVRNVQRTPLAKVYSSLEIRKFSEVQELSSYTEVLPRCFGRNDEEKEYSMRHSLSGSFPSVSLFKEYQNAAMAGSKRNLPSWMSSRDNEDENCGKKPTLDGEGEKSSEIETAKKNRVQTENVGKSSSSSLESKGFNKLLEGVVFVLSDFVNPKRGILRSRAMEMGAEYQPDWNSDCTLLVCAFPNTPKFRQVEADCGTIVSKDWILECYSQRKLIEIESYLMHAGKPWRKGSRSHEVNEEVYSVNTDAEQGKVLVAGDVDSAKLIF